MSGYAPETCIKHHLLSEHICTVAKSSAIKEQNASLEQETPKGFLFSARPVVISASHILVPSTCGDSGDNMSNRVRALLCWAALDLVASELQVLPWTLAGLDSEFKSLATLVE